MPAGVIPALLAMAVAGAFSLLPAPASSMMMQSPEPDKPFVLVDLGVPPGFTDCTVNGISADGRFITGQCWVGQDVAAFVWDRDVFLAEFVAPGPPSPWIILDTQALPGGVGLSVNEAGQVAGTFILSGTQHGFIWCPPNTLIDTGVGQASDIGEQETGQPPVAYVAGWFFDVEGQTLGWQVANCNLQPIVLPAEVPAFPYGISVTDGRDNRRTARNPVRGRSCRPLAAQRPGRVHAQGPDAGSRRQRPSGQCREQSESGQ